MLMQIHPDDAFGEQMIRNLEVPFYLHFTVVHESFVLKMVENFGILFYVGNICLNTISISTIKFS